ncbi:MAG: V-type ATP synthase subunit F [Clostridia bacterium]
MLKEKIAVVGDKDSVLAFAAIGLDVFAVLDVEEAREKVKALARDYSVIFVTEQIAEKISALLDRYKTKTYPAIIPIPSSDGTNGFGMNNIKKDVEKAIGADILFREGK